MGSKFFDISALVKEPQAITLETIVAESITTGDGETQIVERAVDVDLEGYEFQPAGGTVRDGAALILTQPVATDLMIGPDDARIAQALYLRLTDGKRFRIERVGHFGTHVEAWLTGV